MDIAVLLSGGVDSSVAVHLLCEQGYRPSLFYIRISRDEAGTTDCSMEEDVEICRSVSRTTVGRELIALRKDPTSGITTKGRGTAKVYVKAKDDVS